MSTTSVRDILSAHTLFSGCGQELLDTLSASARRCEYAVGDTLKGYDDRPFLCIVLEGEAAVHTKDEHSHLLLRVLLPGDTFGVANLFGQEHMITRVTARKPTVAICIGEEAMRHAICADGELAMRYISFLSDRIRFLNQRISTLSAGNTERRVAAWLDTAIPTDRERWELPLSMNRLANTLGIGRASLYRAFDNLAALGYLTHEGKMVTLTDREAMRRAYGLG